MQPGRGIVPFLCMTFGFSWLVAGIGALFGIDAGSGFPYMLLAATCMLGPALAAIVQQRVVEHQPWTGLGLAVRGTQWRFVVATVLVGISIVPLVLLVSYVLGDRVGLDAFGHVSVSSEQFARSVTGMLEQAGKGGKSSAVVDALLKVPGSVVVLGGLLAAVVAAFTVNLPFMLGEELGWRGYLYQATAAWKPQRRILLTGVAWGLWHAPLILMGHNYPAYPVAGIGLMVLFCLLLAVLFDWSRTRSGSVWSACVLHGIINGSAGLFALFAWGGHPLVASPVGVGGFVALGLLGVLVIALDKQYRAKWSGEVPS
ncbi:MAG: CPBP family intramembrane glutamic endopeptidase [Flavobacteriales bacterium]